MPSIPLFIFPAAFALVFVVARTLIQFPFFASIPFDPCDLSPFFLSFFLIKKKQTLALKLQRRRKNQEKTMLSSPKVPPTLAVFSGPRLLHPAVFHSSPDTLGFHYPKTWEAEITKDKHLVSFCIIQSCS